MTAYSLLKTVVSRSAQSFGSIEKARNFLRTEFCDVVASRLMHEAGCVIPWQYAMQGDDKAQQVLDYLEEHDGRMSGEIRSQHLL